MRCYEAVESGISRLVLTENNIWISCSRCNGEDNFRNRLTKQRALQESQSEKFEEIQSPLPAPPDVNVQLAIGPLNWDAQFKVLHFTVRCWRIWLMWLNAHKSKQLTANICNFGNASENAPYTKVYSLVGSSEYYISPCCAKNSFSLSRPEGSHSS